MCALRMPVPLLLNHLGQPIGPGAGRAEFGIERPAAPGGLDDQNVFIELFFNIDSEGELRTNIATHLGGLIPTSSKTGGQFSQPFAIGATIVRSCQIRHPYLITDAWASIRVAHLLEKRCRDWIFADIVKGADCGMSLHV